MRQENTSQPRGRYPRNTLAKRAAAGQWRVRRAGSTASLQFALNHAGTNPGEVMDASERIAQFRNMAEADPTNEMAHFSLGNALLQAGQAAEAAASLQRCIDLQPRMSKAYQLAGQALERAGRKDDAVRVLTKGYEVAASRGDAMPARAMAEMLTQLGAPVPEVKAESKAAETQGGSFVCQRTGRPGTQLSKPPFRGPLGQHIYETISAETWKQWVGQGTKVINELRLDLSRDDHARIYDQHMIEFLGLEEFVQSRRPKG